MDQRRPATRCLPCDATSAPAPPRRASPAPPRTASPSPTTMHWLTSGWARTRSSSTAGATFLPPAVTRISFLRPVIRTYPSSSISPTSPVWNQPSASASAVACVVAASSPRRPGRRGTAARRRRRRATVVPGSGRPTVPIRWAVGQVDRHAPRSSPSARSPPGPAPRCRGRSARAARRVARRLRPRTAGCRRARRGACVDEPVEQRVPAAQQHARAAAVQRLAVRDRGRDGAVEDPRPCRSRRPAGSPC